MSEYVCPHCKNPINDDEALLCLYCGESLQRATGFMGKMKYTSPRVIATIVALFILLCFVLLILR